MATDCDLYKVLRSLNVCIEFELLKVKVPVIFLGTVGFSARGDGRYNPSEADVFTCGVIYLFISLAYFRLGDEHESSASFSRASEIISGKKPQFLMPGIGTYLYSFAQQELFSAAGWQLPGVLL